MGWDHLTLGGPLTPVAQLQRDVILANTKQNEALREKVSTLTTERDHYQIELAKKSTENIGYQDQITD